jgi:fructosamine-3-kinase
MLRAIAASGAPAPEVIAADDTVLVIARLASRGRVSGAWAALGQAVATLHAATGPGYGWPDDYGFGPVAIPGGRDDDLHRNDWPSFWGERRLLPHLPHLPPPLGRRIERLAARLADRLPAHPRPALLHGDLWGGNVLTDGAAIAGLIDPACCYGHAEADFGMLTLFDMPDDRFWDAYGRPEPGFDARVTVYRLWPALVHLRLFGGRYRGMVERLLDEAGA